MWDGSEHARGNAGDQVEGLFVSKVPSVLKRKGLMCRKVREEAPQQEPQLPDGGMGLGSSSSSLLTSALFKF